MKGVEFGPRAESLGISTENRLGGGGGVDDDDGNVAQLDLVHIAKRFGPLSVFLRSVDANVPQISNQWQSERTLHVRYPGIASDYFISNQVDKGRCDKGGDKR